MYRKLNSDKDTYITNKVISAKSRVSGNVGLAGTLDLFKLHEIAPESSGVTDEYSRVLIHFNLQKLKDLWSSGSIDISDSSFFAQILLKDVYGGQPAPNNFNVSVFPLSASFEEGLGKDLVYYSDVDAANWLSSSRGILWNSPGCSSGGGANQTCDYITGSVSILDTESKQEFLLGTEDLLVDVTQIISATLKGEIPDRGFRVSFASSLENDDNTYFVKRFASRHAYDESKRPKLIFGFNDSIIDDTQNLVFDNDCKINLYNYVKGDLINLVSSSTDLTGTNCLKLKLVAETGGYSLTFSGSQFALGANLVSGTYTSTINVPSSNATIAARIAESGSVKFTPVWMSNDTTLVFVSGSKVEVKKPNRTSSASKKKFYRVSVAGIDDVYSNDEDISARVFIFDDNDPYIKFVKTPVNLSGIVLDKVYYSVREMESGKIVIPFDDLKNSTKVSSDAEGMFFIFNSSCLDADKTYVVDIMIKINSVKTVYQDASPIFRVKSQE